MEKLKKFEDVDVIASLEAIMKQNTAFYQSDFDIDKRILLEAAARPVAEDKRLLWFSRPSGTCCVRERDVFLKDTRQHNTWRFYGEQTRDKILAYAVELTGTERGKLKGNLYELDYPQHFRDVAEKSILADNYTLIYEHGERSQPAGQYFDGNPDPQLGKFERFEAQPNDLEALKALLREQQHSRKQHRPGDFKEHIAALHDCRIETEAHRVVEEMKKFDKPNSPDKSHFSAELSPYFLRLATDKDMLATKLSPCFLQRQTNAFCQRRAKKKRRDLRRFKQAICAKKRGLLFPRSFVFDFLYSFCGGGDNRQFLAIHAVKQRFKLPPLCGLVRSLIRKKELVYRHI